MKPELSKYKQIVLGGASTPLPVWDPQTGATGALAGADSGVSLLTVREDKGALTATEMIYADLMRNLPSRSMLPHLMHELMERDPNRVDWEKHSFLCGYMGPPSIGKSFMLKTLGRLVHPRGVLYMNCKDIDMGSIFCETVFDTSAANREKAAIDAKLLQGNQGGKGLSAGSLEMLRHSLGEAYVEEQRDGKTLVSIDWNGIQVKGSTPEEQNYQKQVIREAISQVCQNEGINIQSDLGAIGITTRDGIAIRAADPKSADYGRPVLLDEINRAKPGTLQKLYEFFAMLSDPKVDRLQVVGGENKPFTFYRKDLPASYRMNFTGNPATRAMGSADMDRPLISRFGVELDIRTVPDPALHDYADRISQTLTGVPLTQIYYSARPFFDANPDKLSEVAREFRLRGLTENEKKNVPEEELLNIKQAARVIKLSEQMAEFFSSVKNVFNPESQIYRGGKLSLSQEYETYLQGIEIDLRLVSKLIEKASVVPPRVLQPELVDYSAAFSAPSSQPQGERALEERASDRGQRLENYLQQWLHQVLVPADAQTRNIKPEECQKVLRLARTLAAHCGIGELKLKESLRGGIERVRDLYDYDKLADPQARHELLRDVMVDLVRERHAELSKGKTLPRLPEENEKIIAVADVQRAIGLAAAAHAPAHTVLAVNADPSGFGATPFKGFAAADGAQAQNSGLLSRDAFLAAFAQPELRAGTLKGLWDKAAARAPELEPSDEALKIAANASETGFAVTTLLTAAGGKQEVLHVFHAAASGDRAEKTVVVGGSLDKRLQALLKSGGVTYVDYQDIGAAQAVNSAIDDCLIGADAPDRLRRNLSAAILLRNGAAGDELKHIAKTPGELMASVRSLETAAPLRLVQEAPDAKPAAGGKGGTRRHPPKAKGRKHGA